MVIDIQPHKQVKPNGLQLSHMETYNYDVLHLLISQYGPETIEFNDKRLAKFLPNYTVSEFIESYILNGISTFVNAHKKISEGLHPDWTYDKTTNEHKAGEPVKISDNRTEETAAHTLRSAWKKSGKDIVYVQIKK